MTADWGFEWGEAFWGEETLTAGDRLLMFTRGPRFIALVQTFAQRTENLFDAIADACMAFDVETAVGVQLDRLGEILQRPRHGYDDDRYRVLLQIQIELILSSTTTTPVILQIVSLFTGQDPTHYADAYPMGFAVGGVVADAADAALLLQLLTEAKAAAYNVELYVGFDPDVFLVDYGSTVAGAGIIDYGSTVATASPIGYGYEG